MQFGKYLDKMSVINFGGGHHITRDDYDIDTLVEVINHFKNEYGLEVYLEPGEAVALNAGFLVTTVLDVIDGKVNGEDDIAILDASAAICPMCLKCRTAPLSFSQTATLPEKRAKGLSLCGLAATPALQVM